MSSLSIALAVLLAGSALAAPPQVTPDNPIKRKALYFPNNKKYGESPAGFSSLEVVSSDGFRLEAWHCPPPQGGQLILYFHGNGGNLSGLGPQFQIFTELGAGVLAIDYRGFGNSQGEPSEQGLYLDAEAAYQLALKLGYPASRIIVYGRSLGGGVASAVAAQHKTAGLVLESTFTSVHDVARRSHGAQAALLVSGFDTLSRLPQITCPILILHGDSDQTIPPDMAKRLHQASANSQLWMVRGADHNNLRKVAGARYPERLRTFLRQNKKRPE